MKNLSDLSILYEIPQNKTFFVYMRINAIPRVNRLAVAFYQIECATTPGAMIYNIVYKVKEPSYKFFINVFSIVR